MRIDGWRAWGGRSVLGCLDPATRDGGFVVRGLDLSDVVVFVR